MVAVRIDVEAALGRMRGEQAEGKGTLAHSKSGVILAARDRRGIDRARRRRLAGR